MGLRVARLLAEQGAKAAIAGIREYEQGRPRDAMQKGRPFRHASRSTSS